MLTLKLLKGECNQLQILAKDQGLTPGSDLTHLLQHPQPPAEIWAMTGLYTVTTLLHISSCVSCVRLLKGTVNYLTAGHYIKSSQVIKPEVDRTRWEETIIFPNSISNWCIIPYLGGHFHAAPLNLAFCATSGARWQNCHGIWFCCTPVCVTGTGPPSVLHWEGQDEGCFTELCLTFLFLILLSCILVAKTVSMAKAHQLSEDYRQYIVQTDEIDTGTINFHQTEGRSIRGLDHQHRQHSKPLLSECSDRILTLVFKVKRSKVHP